MPFHWVHTKMWCVGEEFRFVSCNSNTLNVSIHVYGIFSIFIIRKKPMSFSLFAFTLSVCHSHPTREDHEVRVLSELIRTVLCLVILNVSSWKITENASFCQLNHDVEWEVATNRKKNGENECESQAPKIKGIACHFSYVDGTSLWHCSRPVVGWEF